MAEQLANDIQTLLVADISAGATKLKPLSAVGFPPAEFRIRIDDELMLVTATGAEWTVERGVEGTVAAEHEAGVAIYHVLTRAALLRLLQQTEEATAASGIGRRILRVLAEEKQDAVMLFIGDSTSATYSTYVGKTVDGIAARYPAVTVKYVEWDAEKNEYKAAVEKQKGTGARTLWVYNCAVASQNPYFQMAPYFDVMVASKQPDLIFYSHGHNLGGPSATAIETAANAFVITTQSIVRSCPQAELVLLTQNPRTDANATIQAQRQHIIERVAHLSGFGFVNTHRAFLDADPAVVSLMADEIHPNAAGYTVIANKILSQLRLDGPLGSLQRNAFDQPPAANALLNGDFASFAVPPTLTSWTATNVTLTKDATNFESPNGYAVKMVTATPGTNAYLLQNISGNAFKRFQGEWVTFLARVRIPSGQVFQTGRLEIQQNNGASVGVFYSRTVVGGQGDYRWEMVRARMAKDCTNAAFRIFCSEGAGSGELSVDRAIVVPGIWPRDIR